MLKWAVIAFAVAIVAGIFGFGGVAAGAASVGKVLFYGFLFVAVVTLIMGVAGGRGVTRGRIKG